MIRFCCQTQVLILVRKIRVNMLKKNRRQHTTKQQQFTITHLQQAGLAAVGASEGCLVGAAADLAGRSAVAGGADHLRLHACRGGR